MIKLNQRGSSLVEALITFGILASSAVMILPIQVFTAQQGKYGHLKQLCQNIARSKLDEYRSGDLIPAYATAVGAGGTRLQYLSANTMSLSSVDDAGNVNGGGFFYAKYRYNEHFPYSCSGQSAATIFSAHPRYPGYPSQTLGMRECVGKDPVTNQAVMWDDQSPSPPSCDSDLDARVNREIPGFKLYVKLERHTPWPIAMSGSGHADKYAQYDLSCPNDGEYPPEGGGGIGALYDFNGAGDAIKVTVTGVMDILSVGVQDLAGIDDPNRLRCSATSVIYPHNFPARFYLTSTGRIYTIHGRGLNKSGANWVLESLYTQTGGLQASGILSIAVHPRNFSVYVLRPGTIQRYAHCGGVPLDCSMTSNATSGVSDLGVVDYPAVQEWKVPSSIAQIGVDFRTGNVYGMSGNKHEFYLIQYSNAPLRDCGPGTCDASSATPVSAELTPVASAFLQPSASWPMRLTGFFLAPEGNEAFVSDSTSLSHQGRIYNYSSIYRSSDTALTSPIATIPAAARSFSK